MKTRIFFLGTSAIVILLAICATLYLVHLSIDRAATDGTDSRYTASGDATVTAISSANSQILVQACSFTSVRVAKALVNARNRGVSVSVILDRDQQEARQYAVARYLQNARIATYVEAQPSTTPDNFMIIDGEIVITGSFDRIVQSPKPSRDNLAVASSGELAKTYLASWHNHRENSEFFHSQF